MRFEATRSLADQPRGGRKLIYPHIVYDVAQVEEDRMSPFMGNACVRRIAQVLKQPRSTVYEFQKKTVTLLYLKLSLLQKFIFAHFSAGEAIALEVHAPCEH